MAAISGKNAAVYLQGTGAEASPISQANEWSFDLDFDLEETNQFCAANGDWKTQIKNKLHWTGAVNGNFDDAMAGNIIWEATIANTSKKIYLYPKGCTDPSNYYYGYCWPKLSVGMPSNARGTFGSNFTGDGVLARQ